MHRTLVPILLTGLVGTGLAVSSAAVAHEDDAPATTTRTPNPAALAQLEEVRQVAARFFDERAALEAGYVDIGVFYPKMGHHYLNPALLDATFDPRHPELLVYADDPCGTRRLVAVEYAVPVPLSDRAPAGFVGRADVWTVNTTFNLWTLHAWVFEYNPSGVFAAYNPRVL